MTYSSSISEAEWEIAEYLLHQVRRVALEDNLILRNAATQRSPWERAQRALCSERDVISFNSAISSCASQWLHATQLGLLNALRFLFKAFLLAISFLFSSFSYLFPFLKGISLLRSMMELLRQTLQPNVISWNSSISARAAWRNINSLQNMKGMKWREFRRVTWDRFKRRF